MSLKTPIVIDNGPVYTRVGFAGEDTPRAIFNTVDHDDMEKVWHHAFHDVLKVNPEEHPVLLTDKPLNPKWIREKMTQIMFERFKVPAMYVMCNAQTVLYFFSLRMGLVIHSEGGTSWTVPIYGSVVTHAVGRLDPSADRDLSAIDDLAFKSIFKCDVDIREDIYKAIVLSGDDTMTPSIADRLKKYISNLAPSSNDVKIIAPRERENLAWKGGRMIAGLESFPQMCISKQEYADEGANIVHRKCF